jgi:hypothetical protein
VSIHDEFANMALLIASRRTAASSKRSEEERLWLYLRILCYFINVTGQVYQFEDFMKGTAPPEQPHTSARLNAHQGTLAHSAADLLVKTLIGVSEAEEVEDFFTGHLEQAPMALAYFTSYEEAEAWLKGAAQLPSPARILIGDDYYQFWYMRDDQTRGMYRDYVIEAHGGPEVGSRPAGYEGP